MSFLFFIKKMLFRLICKTFDYIISGNDTQFSGFAQIRNTQFIITQEDMSKSAVEISVSKIRIQFNSLIIICNSRPIILQHGRHIGTIIICINKIRSKINHLIQIFSYHLIIYRSYLFTCIITRNICIGSLFSLLIFQLLATDKRTHKICRKKSPSNKIVCVKSETALEKSCTK